MEGGTIFRQPERRRVGVVLQDNALWPHLDVLSTVSYPLRRQRMARPEAERKARRVRQSPGPRRLRGAPLGDW